jgi:O-antigen/teichoic acid export membrane protein
MKTLVEKVFDYIEYNSWFSTFISITDFRDFLKNIGVVFIFKCCAFAMNYVVLIWAAIKLGPVEFGKIGIVANLAVFLTLIMVFGTPNAMYLYLPRSDHYQKKCLISTTSLGNLLTIGLLGTFLLKINHWVCSYCHIAPQIWQIGILFTISNSFYIVTESFLRGQKEYYAISIFKFISTLIFFVGMVILFRFYSTIKFSDYYLVMIFSFVLFGVMVLLKKGFFFGGFSISLAKQIYSYGGINMLNSLLTALLTSTDIFFVNYFYPGRDVGVYSIYQGFVKNIFQVLFFEVFTVVFLPTIASMDKRILYQNINKYFMWLLIGVIMGIGSISTITVAFFGNKYAFNLLYITLGAVGIGFYTIFQIYNSIFSMDGHKGAGLCLIPLAVMLPFSLLLQLLFTKWYGIGGTMTAVMIIDILLVLIFRILIKRSYLSG